MNEDSNNLDVKQASGSSSVDQSQQSNNNNNNNQSATASTTPPDAFDAAAEQAIATVQAASSSLNEAGDKTSGKKENESGEDKLLIPTDGELNEDGSPKAASTIDDKDKDSNKDDKGEETPEQKTARELTEKTAADAKAAKQPKVDKAGDEKLPFNTHPRWKEVIAQRDTAVTESAQYKQQYETLKPLADRHTEIATFCEQNRILPQEFTELLQIRALMNNDPGKALEKILPVVTTLQAMAGNGIANDLQQKVRDGLLDEDSAKEITKLRAQSQHKELTQRQTAEQQQRAVVAQMETSVTSWFTSKKTADTAFEKKVPMVNGLFSTLCQQTPPATPAQVTALLEKAYEQVNSTLAQFAPAPARRRAPLNSNASRTTPAEPKTIDEFADQAIERLMGAGV